VTSHMLKVFVAGALLALSAPVAIFAEELRNGAAAPNLDCTYNSRAGRDIATFQRCAWVDQNGQLHVTARHLARLTYDSDGLATIRVDRWYYVRRDGRLAPVMALDNWAEPFSDGLARSPHGEKIGYIDRELRLVIPARYDGAFRFERGVAVVCTGCKTLSDGEHSRYDGGMWGCIDRQGRELSPLRSLLPNEAYDANCQRSQQLADPPKR
jgi:WG containing repeat